MAKPVHMPELYPLVDFVPLQLINNNRPRSNETSSVGEVTSMAPTAPVSCVVPSSSKPDKLRLNRADTFKIFTALQTMETKEMTLPAIQSMVHEKLKIDVTLDILNNILRDAGMEFRRRKREKLSVNRNRGRFKVLARSMIQLFTLFEQPVPADLVELSKLE